MTHELNQPLAAILSNAQVGRRRLGAEPPGLAEMDEILHDIVDDAKRAGGIVHGMRAMFTKDADNGPGIPPENLEQLFEPFFSTKSAGKGLGLGLSISRGIVERHGGELIAVPPEDGRGAVFRLTFPPPVTVAKVVACDQGGNAHTPP